MKQKQQKVRNELIDCKHFQNVKGANLTIDPLTY